MKIKILKGDNDFYPVGSIVEDVELLTNCFVKILYGMAMTAVIEIPIEDCEILEE